MTLEQFNLFDFDVNTKVEYKEKIHRVHSVNFQAKTLAIHLNENDLELTWISHTDCKIKLS